MVIVEKTAPIVPKKTKFEVDKVKEQVAEVDSKKKEKFLDQKVGQ